MYEDEAIAALPMTGAAKRVDGVGGSGPDSAGAGDRAGGPPLLRLTWGATTFRSVVVFLWLFFQAGRPIGVDHVQFGVAQGRVVVGASSAPPVTRPCRVGRCVQRGPCCLRVCRFDSGGEARAGGGGRHCSDELIDLDDVAVVRHLENKGNREALGGSGSGSSPANPWITWSRSIRTRCWSRGRWSV